MRNQESSAGVSPREEPDVAHCHAIYSQFLHQVICVVGNATRCQYAVSVHDQTCCRHPAAADIVIATVKRATRNLPMRGTAS